MLGEALSAVTQSVVDFMCADEIDKSTKDKIKIFKDKLI